MCVHLKQCILVFHPPSEAVMSHNLMFGAVQYENVRHLYCLVPAERLCFHKTSKSHIKHWMYNLCQGLQMNHLDVQ